NLRAHERGASRRGDSTSSPPPLAAVPPSTDLAGDTDRAPPGRASANHRGVGAAVGKAFSRSPAVMGHGVARAYLCLCDRRHDPATAAVRLETKSPGRAGRETNPYSQIFLEQ